MTNTASRVGENFGSYELLGMLGRGGMGEVYEALNTKKNRVVALKILRDEFAADEGFRARFLRESHAAAVLQEPHVIPIHDWGEIEGNLFIDMRLVRGRTLYELILEGPLKPDRAVSFIQQVADALDAAHTAGLIHRDVKPQNIIVTAADFAYLADFGIAESQGDARLTLDGTRIGSFAYMSPERFGDERATPAADVYSLACVLYETLTGRTLFRVESIGHLITSHLTAAPPRPSLANPNVPRPLDDVIARGMAKDPAERYQTAGEFAWAARRASSVVQPVVSGSAETMAAPITLGQPSGVAAPLPPSTTAEESSPDAERRGWLRPMVLLSVSAALLVLGAFGVCQG